VEQPYSFEGFKADVCLDPWLLSPEKFFWLNITVPNFFPLIFREIFSATNLSSNGPSGGTRKIVYSLAVFLIN